MAREKAATLVYICNRPSRKTSSPEQVERTMRAWPENQSGPKYKSDAEPETLTWSVTSRIINRR